MDRFLTNYPNLKDVYENTTIQNVARFLILLIVIVGIFALSNGTIGEDYLEGRGFYNSQNITAMDHYFCPNCSTIVPCPYNHNGVGILCPSCGYKTNVIRRGGRAQNGGGVYGSNYYGVGGFGRNGGMGLGPGGNLICPGCGYLMPHQIGVPCYTVSVRNVEQQWPGKSRPILPHHFISITEMAITPVLKMWVLRLHHPPP